MCSGCTCHVQMVCDIIQRCKMAKHRRDMPSVCDLLYECGYSNSMSGNALAYDFNQIKYSNLLSLQRLFCVPLRNIDFTTDLNIK